MNIAIRSARISIFIFAWIFCLLSTHISALAQTDNVCVQCHGSQTGRYGKPVELWRHSIHAENGIACNGCHGGDPRDAVNAMSPARGFLGKPKATEIPGLCGRCHIGVLKDYLSSPHGKKLGRGGPTCVTCHGNHLVKKTSLELINEKACSSCHDFKRARLIKVTMAQTESRITYIDRRIADFKERGIDTNQTEKKLFAVRNSFHRLFHELDIDLLKEQTAEIEKELGKLIIFIKEIDETDSRRKLAGVVLIAAALLAALLLRLYIKSLD